MSKEGRAVSGQGEPAATGRTTASERLARLLTVLPWIASRDGPRLDEVCARFGMSRKQLLDDLEIVPLVGLPPYTPDTLIEVTIEGDRVWLRFADVFAHPLRLTPEQGLALVAAGSAWRGLPWADGDGPLATALDKIAGVLGVDPDEAVSVTLGATRPGLLDTLHSAVAQHRRVRLDYYSYSRDERTSREVDPHAVFAHRGAWYLRGHCLLAKGSRLFRVDRISDVDLLEQTFEPPDEIDDGVFEPTPQVPRVTIRLPAAARWVVETFPVEEVQEHDDGRLDVRLAVSARPWLERLLVRLGPAAQVIDADDPELRSVGRDTARRLLARYEASQEVSGATTR
jgi:proteasome accessory factor C